MDAYGMRARVRARVCVCGVCGVCSVRASSCLGIPANTHSVRFRGTAWAWQQGRLRVVSHACVCVRVGSPKGRHNATSRLRLQFAAANFEGMAVFVSASCAREA